MVDAALSLLAANEKEATEDEVVVDVAVLLKKVANGRIHYLN